MAFRKIGTLALLGVAISGFFVATDAKAASTIFFDGFESAGTFSAFDSPVGANFEPSGGTCRQGPDSNLVAAKITGTNTPHGQILKKTISTAGYQDISISFCFKWDVLEAEDAIFIEYTTDGTTWNILKTIDNTTIKHMFYAADNTELATGTTPPGDIPTPFTVTLEELETHGILFPAIASNKPNFAVRIREQLSSGDDFVWIDDIRLSGNIIAGPTNLIQNPSMETASADPSLPTHWFKGGWGSNTRVLTYPVAGQQGVKAIKAEITQYTNGDAKWYFTEVPVTPGQSYAFSNWFMSNIPSYVAVQFRMANGTFTYLDIGQEAASSATWDNVQTNFTIPANAVSLTVFHIIRQVGYLTVDNYSLTQITDPSDFDTGKVSLAFDDGLDSIYNAGIPILDAAGFKSTQYLISGLLNTPGNMTTANVLTMQSNGHDIGGHTVTHPSLTTLSASQLQTEIGGGRRDLVQLGATPVNSLAYPLGDYNNTIKTATRNSGFSGGRTVDAGFNSKNTDRYALKVQQVNRVATFNQVKSSIDAAIADKTWVILLFHAIDHGSSTFGTTPEILQQIVDYLDTQDAAVITVAQGLALMNPGAPIPQDVAAPVITINGTSPIEVTHGSTYTDAGATAVDNVDGNLTPDIVTSGTVDTSVDGTYEIQYNVTDLAGNAATEATRTVTVAPGSPLTNLIQNPSLETASSGDPGLPLNWLKGGWGTNTRTLTYPVAGQEGNRGAKVEITSYANGDAKWYFQETPVTPGQTYVFSDWYMSDLPSYGSIRFKMSNGTFTYVDLFQANASSASWQNIQVNFTVPANVTHATVFHLIKQVGYLTVDNYSLVSEVQTPTDNLVLNPSVETTSGADPSLPQNWRQGKWGTNTTTFTYPAPGLQGAKSVKIDMTAHTSGDAKWYFDDVTVDPGTSYAFSDDYTSTVTSWIVARFLLAGGGYQYVDIATLPSAASPTHISYNITAPASAVSMTVFHIINSVGSLTTDNFSIVEQ